MMAISQTPESYEVLVQQNPKLIQAFVNGLAAASHYTRQNRSEAVQHSHFDPRISRESLRAFENAQNDLLKLTIKGAKPIRIPDIVLTSYTEAAQKAHPEYFSDLPALSR